MTRRKRYTLDDCKEIAKSKGGECLSIDYVNCVTKMKWRCEHGHEWETALANIVIKKSWCPKCATIKNSKGKTGRRGKRGKITIGDCKQLAISHNGECLSTEYFNNKTKMKWRCEHGHEWESTFANIKHNKVWCPICARTHKYTIEECKEFAINKGGECLSDKYDNINSKLKWKCKHGHVWEASLSSIKNMNSWCPQCALNAKRWI